MNYDYTDRSRLIYDELKDEKMRIGVLKDQTLRAVDEATAKNLLSQVKLHRALENLERNSVEYKKIDKALKRLELSGENLICSREILIGNLCDLMKIMKLWIN